MKTPEADPTEPRSLVDPLTPEEWRDALLSTIKDEEEQ